MCGRYTLINLAALTQAFPWIVGEPPEQPPRYNIAPTQPVLVVANNHADRFEHFHWGLIPSWAKDPSIGNRMINARAETLAEKPAFRTALRRRRCLVPADGFYEWKKDAGGKTKTPMWITMKSGGVFAFAGLWDAWHAPDGSVVPSCTLITTEPNELMSDDPRPHAGDPQARGLPGLARPRRARRGGPDAAAQALPRRRDAGRARVPNGEQPEERVPRVHRVGDEGDVVLTTPPVIRTRPDPPHRGRDSGAKFSSQNT